MSTKTYRFHLSGIKTIAELGLSGTKAEMILWYDVRSETKWRWHVCCGREDPLPTGAYAGSVTASERWGNAVVRR